MIIDSRKYDRPCSCGKTHRMATQRCIITCGCLKDADRYIKECGMKGKSVALYDENTYRATADRHPPSDAEIILSPQDLHADNHGVALALAQLPDDCDYLIAVGSGTIHDITRYCAFQKKIPFISCPTAASVDGFCSSVAAMTWNGFKKTFEAVAPALVIADLDIVSKAPMRLTLSGFGDMVGKLIALTDWKIGHLLTGEHFCESICEMTMDATVAVIKSAELIKTGDVSAYEKLIYGLLMSGLAMQLLGNSRCASGAEHHISHLVEMEPAGLGVKSYALHGEKVGVGTLLACKEYHRIKNKEPVWCDYPPAEESYIRSFFGADLAESIIAENAADAAKNLTASLLEKKWADICAILDTLPTYEELLQKYQALGVVSNLMDIGVPSEKESLLLEYSPLVRNRVTLMRLRRAIKKD